MDKGMTAMRQVVALAEQTEKDNAPGRLGPGQLYGSDAIQPGSENLCEEGRRQRNSHYLTALVLPFVLFLSCFFGCATKKGYFYHPNKTSAETHEDYSQCMHYLDASFNRYGTVYSPGAETWGSDSQGRIAASVERCMKSKGYKIISEKEAKELGVRIQDPWPPYSKTSSSTGP
jgi:hypothetical protein